MDEKMDAVYRGASMQLKDRIEVYYTEEEEWFAGVVQGLEVHWDEDEGEARVLAKILFDSPTEGCWAKGDNPRWHFTDEVRWRKESSKGSRVGGAVSPLPSPPKCKASQEGLAARWKAARKATGVAAQEQEAYKLPGDVGAKPKTTGADKVTPGRWADYESDESPVEVKTATLTGQGILLHP